MKLMVFDVGGTEIKYATIDENLNIENSGYVPTPHDNFESFSDVINSIYIRHKDEVEGIAMSLPGFIDVKNGRCNGGGGLFYNHGTQVGKLLEEKCGCKVVLENDGKAAVKAEYYYGSLKGCTNAAVFIIGTGVGGGLIIDGKVVKGRHFTAGEYSFMNLNAYDFNGFNSFVGSACSTRGLLETYKAVSGKQEDIGGREFFKILDTDENAQKVLDSFTRNISTQIYNLYWLLDIEKIAIGGGISRQDILIEKINEQFDKLKQDNPMSKYLPTIEIDIVRCKYSNDANLIGAYMTFQEEISR